MKTKLYSGLVIVFLILTACAPNPSAPPPAEITASPSQPTVDPVIPTTDSAPTESPSAAPHVDVLDTTRLTLGDSRISSTPQRGYVFSCMTQFNGGGAQGNGAWMNGDGTWDLTKKITVDGSVTWSHSFTSTVQNDGKRLFRVMISPIIQQVIIRSVPAMMPTRWTAIPIPFNRIRYSSVFPPTQRLPHNLRV